MHLKNSLYRAAGILGLTAALISAALFPVQADEAVRLSGDSETGDIVTFGEYHEKSEGDDKDALSWIVLDRTDSEFLLITEKCIAAVPYLQSASADTEELETTWKDCSLRTWLNQVFYAEAFSESEQEQILESNLENPDSEVFDTLGGGNTQDKVFLLSGDEAADYFKTKSERMAEATDAARNSDPEIFVSELNDNSFWWLRSPGSRQECVQVVGAEGAIAESGFLVSRIDVGVRPVIRVKLR